MSQTDLFGQTISPPSDSTSLTVKKKDKVPLSRGQTTFNRLIKKVEKLRKDIDGLHKDLDAALARHTLKVAPAEAETTRLHVELIDLLYPYYTKTKALSAKERRTLGAIISELLDDVIGCDEEALERHKKMYKKLNGEHYDEVVSQDMEMFREGINEMFAAHGLDLDLGDLDFSDDEAVARKMHELREKFQAEQERMQNQPPKRKKTKRQLEMEARAEEMEKARNLSLSTMYKQLARTLHPDLEPDEALRAEKEELMKQLTVAYEAQDLHTLLKLEAQWMSRNSGNIQALTEQKLAIYNAVLKEQIEELEVEYHRTMGHPRYEPLMDYGMHYTKSLLREIDIREVHLRMRNRSLEESIANLRGKNPLKEVQMCIQLAGSRLGR
jgi:hypothetical protein